MPLYKATANKTPTGVNGLTQWAAADADETDTSDSAKGLKAGTAVLISGGVFELDASDDAVHSNGTMDISGGNFTISTGDDGFHSDGALSISAGTIQIHTSYEGIEGLSIAISGGDLTVSASDDGLNAAGGSDGSMGFDRDFFAEGSDSDCFIRISGGTLTIAAQGDGIDSNGALYLEGGTVYISGLPPPTAPWITVLLRKSPGARSLP